MECLYCRTHVPVEDKFCPECGLPARSGCLRCGSPLHGGEKFCPQCGAPASPPAPADACGDVTPAPVDGLEYLNDDRVLEKRVVVGPVSIRLVFVPAGEFVMGSGNDSDFDFERPAHKVAISNGFWLGKYTVTQGQWSGLMASNPAHFHDSPSLPVDSVSWNDCQRFLAKLNGTSGRCFRLPTEAEWEYACRANARHNPDAEMAKNAWYEKNSGGRSQPVGRKAANPWGLYDMLGNVYEWCQDWFGEHYYAGSPPTDPPGPSAGRVRVNRGGSWQSGLRYLRCAYRRGCDPAQKSNQIGFRLLLPG